MYQPDERENRLWCPACKTPSLPENRFCSQCGTILDASLSPLGQALLANVSEQVVDQMAEEIDRRNQALGRRLMLWLGFPALIVLFAAVFFVAKPLLRDSLSDRYPPGSSSCRRPDKVWKRSASRSRRTTSDTGRSRIPTLTSAPSSHGCSNGWWWRDGSKTRTGRAIFFTVCLPASS
jgi:hypothetical protein